MNEIMETCFVHDNPIPMGSLHRSVMNDSCTGPVLFFLTFLPQRTSCEGGAEGDSVFVMTYHIGHRVDSSYLD